MELYAITDKEKRLKMDFEDLTKGFIAPKSFNLGLTLLMKTKIIFKEEKL